MLFSAVGGHFEDEGVGLGEVGEVIEFEDVWMCFGGSMAWFSCVYRFGVGSTCIVRDED